VGLVGEGEAERPQVEEVVVRATVLVSIVGGLLDACPGEEGAFVVEPAGDDVRAESVVASLVDPQAQHERPGVPPPPAVRRQREAGDIEAEVEPDEGRPVAPAGAPQHPLAELVSAEDEELRAGVALVRRQRGQMARRVAADDCQGRLVSIVGNDQSLLGHPQARDGSLPAHPHVAVGGDDQLLAPRQLGLAVEHDERPWFVPFAAALLRLPAVGERPCPYGHIEWVDVAHLSVTIRLPQ
jgi:hypothetical protein